MHLWAPMAAGHTRADNDRQDDAGTRPAWPDHVPVTRNPVPTPFIDLRSMGAASDAPTVNGLTLTLSRRGTRGRRGESLVSGRTINRAIWASPVSARPKS